MLDDNNLRMKRIILSCIGIVLSPRRILPLPFRKKNISKKSDLKGATSEMLPFKSFLGPTFIRKSTPHSVLLNSINFIIKYLWTPQSYQNYIKHYLHKLNTTHYNIKYHHKHKADGETDSAKVAMLTT